MFKKTIFICFLILAQYSFAQSEEIKFDDENTTPTIVYRLFSFMFVPGLQTGNSADNNLYVQLGFIAQADNILGLQISALNIVNNDLEGLQIAFLANSTLGKLSGIQISPAINYAGTMEGFQVALVANVANEILGTQISYVNFATKVIGVQWGFINIAGESKGISVGLLNFIKDGIFQVGYHRLSNNADEITYKTGNKWFYTKLSGTEVSTGDASLSFGFGARLSLKKILYLEQDILIGVFREGILQTTVGLFPNFPVNIEGAVSFRYSTKFLPIYSVGAGFDFAKLVNMF